MKQKQPQAIDSSQAILKQPQPQPQQKPAQPVGFFSLFRFANRTDYIIMTVGTIASVCNGASMPLFALLWGNMIDSFKSKTEMVDQTKNMLLLFVYIGLAVFFTGWVMIACWLITGQRQSIQCRKQYLKSLLRQQIGWFDSINQSELSSQFSTDTMAFQGAISDKIPLILYVISMGISGMVVAFSKGWLLTLVLLGVFPVLLGSMYLYMYNVQNKGKREEKSYAVAGGRAQQALAAIKTVKMLNGQNYQSYLYDECLVEAGKGTVAYGAFAGISLGGAFFSMLTAYSLGFWYGANCINQTFSCPYSVARQEYSAGIVFTVFFSIIIVGFNMSQLPPSLKKITEGRSAAGRIFKIIDREPKVKNPVNGVIINDFKGIIQFKNVTFSYPKQPTKKILDNLSLTINKNKIAFVGESGCGKSTIMQLIMRFYDPDQGSIFIDGHDLRTIDLVWLREAIGYVGQEPVLFDTTIRENLLFANQKATVQQLESALKKAQAYEFVSKLEKGMDTNVGLGGGQISGGQKQRIAIARAILRDPKILLLDEATSALDRKNQKLIQRTLNKISEARTSITIAHRVKTVMNSDQIFVVEKGKVKEHGKFEELKRFEGMKVEKQQEQEENMNKNIAIKEEQLLPQQAVTLEKRLTKEQAAAKQKEELMEVYNKNTYSRVFSYARGNQILFVIGVLASGLLGAVYPVFSIFLSSMLQIMLSKKNFMEEANTKALIFFLLGVLGLFLSIVQNMVFEYIGQKITSKIRSETFNKLMKLPIYWYERPKNSVGCLTSNLAVDCKKVKDMTTTTIYGLVQNVSTLVVGLVIAFIFQWRTSLVALGLIPFLIAAGAIRMAFRTGSATKAQKAYKHSSNLIMQSMTNIRTVCSFGYENIIYNKYSAMMQQPFNLAVKNGLVSGFFYGIAQLIMFIVIALVFYLGSLFVDKNGVSVDSMFTSIFAIFFSAMTVGNNSHILPDMGECKISAANLFLILDTKDESQIQIDQNSKMIKDRIRGDIVLKDIKFKYETRSEYLFNGFNLKIPYGEKVAFVGTSGCGKSTILAFLQRFYEPESGTILLNGVNIKDYDIHYLREQFGVVSQEPVLFNASFKENIKYNLEKATDEDIVKATRQAHAYDFIMGSDEEKMVNNFVEEKSKPNPEQEQIKEVPKTGFQRSVGLKGSHISGGQKQRVAIARAILRKPQILLLDEATSALDSVNQKKVQQCLDEIMTNKTCISIAHRLDTIRNSKVIYVFDKGRIAQSGNYEELLEKKGYFYNLEKGIEFK